MKEKIGINPWVKIWTNPKEAIQKIITYKVNYGFNILCAIYGIVNLLNIFQAASWGTSLSLPYILLLSIFLSWLFGYLIFSLLSFITYITGKILFGKGTYKQLRAALAWAHLPLFITLLTWIILLIVFKESLFQNFMVIGSFQTIVVFCIKIIQFILSIWSLVIYINALSQVQQFSILKAILNMIFAMIILIGISYIGIWLNTYLYH